MEEKINEREALNSLEKKNEPIECHELFKDEDGDNLRDSYSKKLFIYNMFVSPFIMCFKCAFFETNRSNNDIELSLKKLKAKIYSAETVNDDNSNNNNMYGSVSSSGYVPITNADNDSSRITKWDRFWAFLFLLTFICGVAGLAVGIVLNLLVLKIIAVVLLVAWLLDSYKCATTMKDDATYYVQVISGKEENQNGYKEVKISSENNKDVFTKNDNKRVFTKEDENWYLLIVAKASDEEKSNLNIVPIRDYFPDSLKFNRLRIDKP